MFIYVFFEKFEIVGRIEIGLIFRQLLFCLLADLNLLVSFGLVSFVCHLEVTCLPPKFQCNS